MVLWPLIIPKGGAIVVKVYPDSTSFKSGLREGDIITTANDTSVLKDYDLGQVIYNKEFIKLKVNRGGKTLDMSMHKGPFMETEGFKVGSTKTVSKDENIPDSNIIDQANYGLNKMKEGTIEYSVEGISFLGAFIIAFLWGLSILPVLILGMFFYKKIINIRHKILIILLNLISIPIIMSLVMFLLYISGFF